MSSEWYSGKLGDVIELKRGYDLPQAKRNKGVVPLVSSSGVSDSHNTAMVKGPGVVTGRYGTIGQVFYVEDDFWPLNTTLYVRDFKGNHPKFVHYFLKTLDFLAYSDKAAVPGVNRNHLHEASIFMPPVTEQKEIASFLGALDDRITLLRETNATLEAIAQALFKSWFVDFDPVRAKAEGLEPQAAVQGCTNAAEGRMPEVALDATTAALFPGSFEESELGLVPKGWRVGSILDIANLLSGGTPKTDCAEYWGGDIPWASAKDVSQAANSILTGTDRTITDLGLQKSSTKMIPAFSTVVVARGATTGRMVMFGKAMAMNQTCYALESKAGTPIALYLVLKKEIDALTQKAHGSVFDTITTSTFSASKTLLIPDRLLTCFESVAGPLFHRMLAGTQKAETLTQLRDTLLPRLISGQLRLPAAEALLEGAL